MLSSIYFCSRKIMAPLLNKAKLKILCWISVTATAITGLLTLHLGRSGVSNRFQRLTCSYVSLNNKLLLSDLKSMPKHSFLDTSMRLNLSWDTQEVPDNGIYFLETSGASCLSPKQLCSIESAAKHHPGKKIVVGINSDHILKTPTLKILLNHHPNIHLFQIDLPSWLKGSLLESWLEKGLLERSNFVVEHTSDLLRLVTLFKHGGIYLDLDIIVVKPLDGLKNAVGLEAYMPVGANNAVLIFDKSHPVLGSCIEGVAKGFDGKNWASNGPILLSRVLNEWCGKPSNQSMLPTTCSGVHLLDIQAFYAVPYSQWEILFADQEEIAQKLLGVFKRSYTVHLWNKMSFESPIVVNSRSALGYVLKENCPLISRDFEELW